MYQASRKSKSIIATNFNWKRILMLFVTLVFIVGAIVFAYDGPGLIEEYHGNYIYPYEDNSAGQVFYDIPEHTYSSYIDKEYDALEYYPAEENDTYMGYYVHNQTPYEDMPSGNGYNYHTGGGYISISPFSPVVVLQPGEIQDAINNNPNSVAGGVRLTMELDFDTYVTEPGPLQVPTIVVGPDDYVKITNYPGRSPQWVKNNSYVARHIVVEPGGRLILENIVLTRDSGNVNISNLGGGVTVNSGELVIQGTTVISHNRWPVGGGVDVINGGSLYMHNGEIINNIADDSITTISRGGGVAILGGSVFTMSGGSIFGNDAFNTPTALDDMYSFGGGVYVSGNNGSGQVSRFIMNDNSIVGYDTYQESTWNRATYGGGVAVTQGAEFILNNGTISGNNALGGVRRIDNLHGDAMPYIHAMGGGVFVFNVDSSFTMYNGVIRNNTAALKGGGVGVLFAGSFVMEGGFIRNNITAGGIGVTVLGENSVFLMEDGEIYSNVSAGDIDGDPGSGGGVSVMQGALFHMNDGTIRDNIVTPHLLFMGPIFIGMTPSAGGGVMVIGGGHFVMDGGTISGNRATRGGGVEVSTPHTVFGDSIFEMRGGTISGNDARVFYDGEYWAGAGGGGVHVNMGGWFNMVGTPDETPPRIIGNRGNSGGGIFVTGVQSAFTMSGGIIGGTMVGHGNSTFDAAPAAAGLGGGAHITTGSWFDMTAVAGAQPPRIVGNTARHGGGVHLGAAALFTMDGGIIGGPGVAYGNHASFPTTGSGGGIRAFTTARLYMSGGIIQYNEAAVGGGVAAGGTAGVAPLMMPIMHSFVYQEGYMNEAPYYYEYYWWVYYGFDAFGVSPRPTRPVQGSFPHTFIMSGNAQIINNEAAYHGGGVLITGATTAQFHMRDNALIAYNEVAGTISGPNHVGGGGVDVRQNAVFNMASVNAIIRNNKAIQGGGVQVSKNGSFTMNSGVIRHNEATRGGGIALVDVATDANGGGNFTMQGNSNIHNNIAGIEGGGIWADGVRSSATISGGTVGGNPATNNGNTALRGAGVWVGNGATLTMNQSIQGGSPTYGRVYGNYATGSGMGAGHGGGGVFVTGGYTTGGVFTPSSFIMSAGRVDNNQGDRGGGVKLVGGAYFNMSAGSAVTSVSGNRAFGVVADASDSYTGSGGGVFALGTGAPAGNPTTFYMGGGYISSNISRPSGGVNGGAGVRLSHGALFNMSGGVIGGGDLTYGNTFYLNNGVGAGVKVHNSNFNMYGNARISYNCVGTGNSSRGGGVDLTGNLVGSGDAVTSNSNFTMSGSAVIRNNRAGTFGGGVFVAGGIFTIKSGTIAYNSVNRLAGNGGGGVGMGGGRVHMQGGTIRNHDEARNAIGTDPWITMGGGVRINGGMFIMSGTASIIDNTAGRDGGGVMLSGGTFEMRDGLIANNIAYGLAVSNPVIGPAVGRGGGVSVLGGTFNMLGGTIYDNTALGNAAYPTFGRGGGVHVGINFNAGGITSSGIFNLDGEDALIYGNTAEHGGGVSFVGGSFEMRRGTIHDNTATGVENLVVGEQGTPGRGGGINIYLQRNAAGNILSTGHMNLAGTGVKNITYNNADYGGGIWVAWEMPGTPTGVSAIPAAVTMLPGSSNLVITGNTATRHGGGIYTQNQEYAEPLTRIQANSYSLENIAFGNLRFVNGGVTFNNNTASILEPPPSNAGAVLPGVWFVTTSESSTHPLNNFDINFTRRLPFAFHKADARLYTAEVTTNAQAMEVLLAGAHFRLFRTNVPTDDLPTPLTATCIILFDSSNDPIGPWVEVVLSTNISTNVPATPMSATISPHRYTYQLAEVLSPPGFQIPAGQWRITENIVGSGYSISVVGGGHTPGFVNLPGDYAEWFVGNMPDFELPLTGGSSASMFIVAGCALICAGLVAAALLVFWKKKNSVLCATLYSA